MKPQLRPYAFIADAIAQLFAPHVEAVLHDTADGKVAHIANAFSKRRPGDDSLIGDDPVPSEAAPITEVYGKSNWNGRRLRSISVRLTDVAGAPIGFLCINHDVEALSAAQEALLRVLAPDEAATPPKQLFARDWREEVNGLVAEFLRARSVTLDGLTAGEQDALLRTLDERGVFEVRTAPSYVASVFGWSRQTLYARLKAARGGSPELKIIEETSA